MNQDQLPEVERAYASYGEVRNSVGIVTPCDERPNTIRNVEIRQVNRGYIVNVGCHTFVFETSENLIKNLNDYISNPSETEAKWFKNELFK